MNAFQTQTADGARLSGKIKWFNRSKGFGFILPNDGQGDIFLPGAVLDRSGFGEAPDGADITFEWMQGPKGRSATQVLNLDTSGAVPRPSRADGPHRTRHDDGAASPTESMDGVVKWYDAARGFGFILPRDGGKDVFIHITVLRRAGLEELQPGQNVRVDVAEARRGREAISLHLAS
jgi:CspA family cold shock protein